MEKPMLTPSEETLRSLRSLRVVRHFRPEPVSDHDLDRILEVARWTGSSKNRQSWVFVVIRDRTRLDSLAECGSFTTPIKRSSLVIAPVGLPEVYEWDLGRVSQNIMLAAAALGVGSCPVTLHRTEEGRAVLGLPDDHVCSVVIALGYPDETAEQAARNNNPLSGRKVLSELVRFEGF
jgi:nitroreductase